VHAAGAVGVEMFFVISGFLITLLLLREQRRDGSVSLTGFYLRRAFRIIPAYAMFLVARFLLECAGAAPLPAGSWLRALTYSTSLFGLPSGAWDLNHTWSLSVEEHFYLLWPCVFVFFPGRAAPMAALGCVAVTPLVRVILHVALRDVHPDYRFFSPTRMDAIAVGCCLAFWATCPGFRNRMRLPAAWASAGVAVVVTCLAVLCDPRSTFGDVPALGYVDAFLSGTLRPVLLAAVVWLCIGSATGVLGRILNCRPLAVVGVLSYSLYLWQQLFLNPEREHWACGWPGGLIFTAIAAVLSYGLIEKPFLALKERLGAPHDRAARREVVIPALSGAGSRNGGEPR
jgi:peptidoglycan/LPS O-acetylase OafA/YrhL